MLLMGNKSMAKFILADYIEKTQNSQRMTLWKQNHMIESNGKTSSYHDINRWKFAKCLTRGWSRDFSNPEFRRTIWSCYPKTIPN